MSSSFFTNITSNRKDFIGRLPAAPGLGARRAAGRVMALDLGLKRTGVALSDPSCKIASQFGILQKFIPANQKNNFSHQADIILALIKKEGVVGLVVGLPLNMDGGENKQTQRARQYAQNLVKHGVAIPLLMMDERLTSQAVDKLLADEKRKDDIKISTRQKNKVRDQMAASFLLQGLLDEINNFA